MEELLEEEQDPRLQAAQRANLDIYWANFGGAGERYLLFVGKRIGLFGPEDLLEMELQPSSLVNICAQVAENLEAAGLPGSPGLHIQWEQDS